MLVEPIIFIKDGDVRVLQRGNIAIQIPHDLEMVIHLTAAAHIESLIPFIAIARTPTDGEFFQDVDVLAFYLSVADEVKRRGESG